MVKKMVSYILLLHLTGYAFPAHCQQVSLNDIARHYVKLGLAIGVYDTDFVDAYYGPDSLRPAKEAKSIFPKDDFLRQAKSLQDDLSIYLNKPGDVGQRARWLNQQLTAYQRRIRIFAGEFSSFDTESKELFGVAAPEYPESYFKKLVSDLDKLLPGNGDIPSRFQSLASRFVIPVAKLDTVFKTAIAESRKRTNAHYVLPGQEHFTLEFVKNKSWSGYNWYQGNYNSLIQINTDIQIFIERAIDVASHESYPGHHVYNMLLEKNLYRDKDQVEISFYPLFSPQSLIAEGSANYGIDVVFPGKDKVDFAKKVLLPLAGLDTTGIELYFQVLALKGRLNFVRNEVGRGLLNKTMDEKEALRWLMDYGLNNEETANKSIGFIRKYRSYVINYNYGLELVKNYIEGKGGLVTLPAKRWELFGKLLSEQVCTSDLFLNK